MASSLPERLREIPLFSELSDGALRSLSEIAAEVEVPAGQVMIRPYDPGLGMFVVEEGKFFGELALLIPEGIRAARVRAETDVRCLAIGREDFAKLVDDEPSIAVAML